VDKAVFGIVETTKKESENENMKMSKKLLTQCESVKYWLAGLEDSSVKLYLKYFPKVIDALREATGLETPDDILEARKADLKSDDNKQQFRFEHLVKVWYHQLYDEYEKAGKSTESAFNYFRTAQSFFARNRYPLRYRRKELKKPKKKIKRIALDIDDLREAYGMIEDIRDRALFTVALQSGLSPVDVCELKWEELIDPKTEKLKEAPIHIQGYREKTTSRFQSCLGYDAVSELKRLWILNEQPLSGLIFKTVHGTPMTTRYVNEALTPTIKKIIPKFQVKMLRDFYHDALERANLPKDVLNRMFGHEIVGAGSEYLQSPHTIMEAYERAYIYLSVDGHGRKKAADMATQEMVMKLAHIIAMDDPRKGLVNLIEEIKGVEAAKDVETHEDLIEAVDDALKTYFKALRTE